jgi:hypothetical protein
VKLLVAIKKHQARIIGNEVELDLLQISERFGRALVIATGLFDSR